MKTEGFYYIKIFICTQKLESTVISTFKPVSFEYSSAIIINDYNYLYWAFI